MSSNNYVKEDINNVKTELFTWKKWKWAMLRSRSHNNLWEFCLTYVTDTNSLTAHPICKMYDRTPYGILNGNTPDIQEFIEHDLYAPVWYLYPREFTEEDL